MNDKFVTILVVPHDERNVRRVRLSYRRLRVLGVAGLIVLGGGVAGAVTWGQVASRAARAKMLERQNERLVAENATVGEIAANLERTEEAYRQIRAMAGLGEEAESVAVAPVSALGPSAEGAAEAPPPGRPGPTPSGWPLTLRGFVTAEFTGRGGHTGIDIAAPLDTPVVATADGTVKQTGRDPVYGVFVIVLHRQGFETMYAHNGEVLVERGEEVRDGQTIAISGNSGQSSAPHLHYEVRRNGQPLDPTPFLR